MTFIDLLIAVAATTQIVGIWLEGSIFRDVQSRLLHCRDNYDRSVKQRLCELLTCQFCLMPWTALLVVSTLFYTDVFNPLRLPLYAFAVAKLGHTWNDLQAKFSITEEREMLIDEPGGVEPLKFPGSDSGAASF